MKYRYRWNKSFCAFGAAAYTAFRLYLPAMRVPHVTVDREYRFCLMDLKCDSSSSKSLSRNFT